MSSDELGETNLGQSDAVLKPGLTPPRISPFYSLTFRNFRLFFIGQLISVAGTWMQAVAQQWLVYDLTHQARWLGILSGASAIPYVLFAMSGGAVADRFPRRTILVWTQTIQMILAFILAILATNRWIALSPLHIVALAAVGGIVNAYNMPAQQAFVSDMVDDPRALGNAIALNSFRFNMARFLGPIMAGVVLVKYGPSACFTVNGLSFLAVIVSLMMMRMPRFIRHEHAVSLWEGLRFIWKTKSVLRVVILVGVGAIFLWSVSTLYPVFAARFNVGAKGFSTMVAANGVGAALGGLLLTLMGDRLPRLWQIYGGGLLFCFAVLCLSFAPTFQIVLIILVISGISMITFNISANTKVQEEVPNALRGRVMAVYTLVFQGFMPIGGLEIGFMADRIGAIPSVRINASIGLTVLLLIIFWRLFERKRSSVTI